MKYLTKMNSIYRFAFVIIMAVISLSTTATSTYYYKATANISPTASGKVYVGTAATNNPDYKTTSTTSGSQGSTNSSVQVTFYYYAQANEDYIFDHWARGSAGGTSVSTSPSYTVTETVTSEYRNNPTSFTYYAVFKNQTGLVKVTSMNNSRGTVTISDTENTIGDNVTLTAYPDVANGVIFLGWRKNDTSTGDYISTNKVMTITVTDETKGTYYAYFSEPEERVYCRIRNKGTGKFLSIYGDTPATAHNKTISGKTAQDGFIFTNSLKMISAEEAQGNPTTVFLRTGTPTGIGVSINDHLAAQGVDTYSLTGNKLLTMVTTNDGNTKIYTQMTASGGGNSVDFNSYLCDEGSGWLVMKSDGFSSDNDVWEVITLHEDTEDWAFGANTKAKFTKDGKYYTTMYTAFPYKLLDGVKAYYLPASGETSYNEETNTVVFTEVTTGKIPEYTAVILECDNVQNTSGTAVTNRLLPLANETVESVVGESLNLLKGYLSLNGSTKPNNKELMYVLSSSEGTLGFFHSSKAAMTANKAYLELPETLDGNSLAKTATFSFGQPDEEEPTGIKLSEKLVDQNDNIYYDLQGRVMGTDGKSLRPGIYIYNSKKIIIKK